MSSFTTTESEKPIDDPERQAAVTSLSNINKDLYQGPIDAIHNPRTHIRVLIGRGLMQRLQREGLKTGEGDNGLTVFHRNHENMEGSYYARQGESTLRYRVNGDHCAYLDNNHQFDFSHKNPEVSAQNNLKATDIKALAPWLEGLKRVLDQGFQEARAELKGASTPLDETQKENAATALLQLARLRTQSPVIFGSEESAASLLWAPMQLKVLGIRLNPAIVEAMIRDIDTIKGIVERQANSYGSEKAPEGILERVRSAVANMMHRTPDASNAQELTRQERIRAAKAQQLKHLEILRIKVSGLSDPALGMELGSDAFISKSLEFLGYKKPQMAVGEA